MALTNLEALDLFVDLADELAATRLIQAGFETSLTPTGDKGPAPSGQPAGRKLLEADRVTFGASRKAKAPKTRPKKRPGGSRRPKSKAPEMVPPGSAATPDLEAERRAVEVVTRFGYEVRGAVEVRDVQSLNKGWDLEFHFADKSWEPVEAKGSLGHALRPHGQE
jgi:hypothetical protein